MERTKRKLNYNLIIVNLLILAILGGIFIYPFASRHTIFNGDDLQFHIQRIYEMIQNIKHGNLFPGIFTYSYFKIGEPYGIFYPQVTLLPFALIGQWTNLVNAFYGGVYFYTLLGMGLMYFVSYKLFRNRFASLISASVWAFANCRTYNLYARMDVGEFIVMSFVPLVIYGFYQIIRGKYQDWPYLAIGVALILMTHVLSSVIIVTFLVLTYIVTLCWTNHRFKKFKTFALSAVLALMAASITLFPLIQQKHSLGEIGIIKSMYYGDSLSQIIDSSLNNSFVSVHANGVYAIGLMALIILVLGLINFKRLTSLNQYLEILGILTLIMSSSAFPWKTLSDIMPQIDVIQFPMRFLLITTSVIPFIAAELYAKFSQKINHTKVQQWVGLAITILLILLSWMKVNQIPTTKFARSYVVESNLPTNFDQQAKTAALCDYLPPAAQKNITEITKHVALVDEHKVKLNPQSKPNELIFKVKQNSQKLDLPVLYNENLKAFVAGKQISVEKSKRGTVLLKNVGKGTVSVKYQTGISSILISILSILSWIVLIGLVCFKSAFKQLFKILHLDNLLD